MTAETVVYTTLIGGDEPIEELPAEIISYGFRLNRPGHIRFALSVDHPKCRRDVIWPGTHEAVVVRNRQIVWRGPILAAREGERFVEFAGEGLLAYLKRWYVTSDLDYSAGVDIVTIARNLIDHHQDKAGGDFGIDTSGSETSRTHQHTYYADELKNVYEAVIELAERDNGFDFRIDPETRRFIPSYPRAGMRKPDLLWEDGIRGFTRDIDTNAQASQILAVGEGEGDSMLRTARQSSSAVAEFGLTQSVYTNKSVSRFDTLIQHADRQLQTLRSPRQQVQVTVGPDNPTVFSYRIGDEGRLVYDSPYDSVSEYRRLVGFDITWTEGIEQVTLYLEPIL
ncbi:MAG: hypothetical protein WC977_11090 [Anaerovoracaceae bacterium]